MGMIVFIPPSFEVGSGKKLQQIRKWYNPFIRSLDKGGPVAKMLFRPEEIHGASGIGGIFKPFPEGHGDVSLVSRRFLVVEDLAVLKDDLKGLAAIETGKIHRHRLTGEKPADRQRFKGSLAEPFLLAFNGDAVLGGKIVERRERDNQVGSRVKPSRYARGEKIVEGLSAFFYRKTEFGCQFGVKRGLAGFYHAFHDGMKGLVEHSEFTHGWVSFLSLDRHSDESLNPRDLKGLGKLRTPVIKPPTLPEIL
jgi:hypothetical protein